ncbi:MAG TPA: hypothetical protein VEB19_09065 [Gemmatimonadaceae bacterium]|nr:hypothetical protein [Gemmatimonadaceae bacterium]
MQHVTTLAVASGVGLLSGTHTAIWGMYKDAVHEGFTVRTFVRSIIVGAFVAAVIQWAFRLPIPEPGALVLLFGLAYAGERGIVEVWKTFFRDEDQSKYFIPMQFAIGGEPVKSRATRIGVGIAYIIVVSAALYGISRLDFARDSSPSRLTAALVGFAVGIVIAIGGGWKDAPKEGFDLLKFFRSPILTVIYSVLLSRFTDSYLLMACGSIGFERATAETYKTFFFPSKPRGKFSGKPILFPQMLKQRQYFVPVYVAIWAAVLVCVSIAV